METVLRQITPDDADRIVEEAASALKAGQIVALPTETVYGLGANMDHPGAMKRLIGLKQRPPDKPFTLHLADPADYDELAAMPNRFARKLIQRYWPGPLTLVVRTGADTYQGLRVPGLEITRKILRMAEVPVVLPSANPAGQTPACTAREVLDYFQGDLELVVDDGKTKIGDPSTVVRIEDDALSVLRAGIISPTDILQTACRKILFVCTGNTCRSPMAEGILKKLLCDRLGCDAAQLPYRGYLIRSAGLSALAGERTSMNALRALQKWRIDLSGHRSQPLTDIMPAQSDRIFVMTLAHQATLRDQLGADLEQVELLDRSGRDIEDPFGGSESVYTRCASQIYTNLLEILETL